MDIGMLWFDNDKKSDLNIKVTRAVTYYHEKYGQKPNLCFVNPCMMKNGNNGYAPKPKASAKVNGEVEIRESQSMLPNHLWIGINRKKS